MMRLQESIYRFLISKGFDCRIVNTDGIDLICVTMNNDHERYIMPIEVSSASMKDAHLQSSELKSIIMKLSGFPLVITEDRWNSQRPMMQARLLAHLESFFSVYARNCEIRKIDKADAAGFLEDNHSYGDAACRYRYGMFLKRHTGWRFFADNRNNPMGTPDGIPAPGTLIAVAEFSNARKWIKGDKTIKSYEWTRYASLPGLRINGGMGKMLKHFIKEVQPDDIMSYADLEWSEGSVYEQLGFVLEGQKEPVTFIIDTKNWKRTAISKVPTGDSLTEDSRYFHNFGSNKYRLKLTDYQ